MSEASLTSNKPLSPKLAFFAAEKPPSTKTKKMSVCTICLDDHAFRNDSLTPKDEIHPHLFAGLDPAFFTDIPGQKI